MRRMFSTSLTCLVLGCGGSSPPAEHAHDAPAETGEGDQTSASPEDSEQESAVSSAAAKGLPKECVKKDPCTPDARFADKLCQDSYPSVALFLFHPELPFARGYLRGRTKAWNASGGASDAGFLEFDEEVLLLRVRKADPNGMQVSGAGGSYDALRWDGSCVTLSLEEVTLERPPAAKSSKVEFRFLEPRIQEALREDQAVSDAYKERRKECKGASSGEVSLKCVKADARLSEAIVKYVRAGGKIPEPERLP
jgi:hypothetical protein